jgi:hypothetical protein
MVVGYLLLAVGYILLAVGCLLLVVGWIWRHVSMDQEILGNELIYAVPVRTKLISFCLLAAQINK